MLHEYRGHTSSVNSVDFSPPEWDLTIGCASSDGAISVVTHTPTGEWKEKKIVNAHDIGCNSISWAPPHNPQFLAPGMVADPAPVRFVSGGCDNLVKIWQRDDMGEWKTIQVRITTLNIENQLFRTLPNSRYNRCIIWDSEIISRVLIAINRNSCFLEYLINYGNVLLPCCCCCCCCCCCLCLGSEQAL